MTYEFTKRLLVLGKHTFVQRLIKINSNSVRKGRHVFGLNLTAGSKLKKTSLVSLVFKNLSLVLVKTKNKVKKG